VGVAVRQLRESAGLSLSELARRSGLGKATLSQLEAGVRNPTLDTLFAVTTALHVPLGTVLEAAGQLTTSGTAVDALLLDRYASGTRVGETYRLHVRAARQASSAHAPGTTETLVVLHGRLVAGPVAHPFELAAGQSVTFPADVPHVYEAVGEPVTCLLVMTYTATGDAPGR
jgi:transcriptional regulator with XRE-family HTH domain